MKPIDFNAMAVALKAAIESKDEFTRSNFINTFKKFVQGTEAERFFSALNNEHYIRNTKGYKYVFVIEPGIANRHELIKLFDRYKVRRSLGHKVSDEQRAKSSERMKNRWLEQKQVKPTMLQDISDEDLEAEFYRRQHIRDSRKRLDDILTVAEINLDDLKQLINMFE